MNYITRPQAEALLTLAEALEACERVGVQVQEDTDGLALVLNGKPFYPDTYGRVDGMSVRLAVNALVPTNGS